MMLLTVGLEIHCKIKSETKLFCQCVNSQEVDDDVPNTAICPVCTGQPGALPVLQYPPLMAALRLGKLLNCTINPLSGFDRKSYFYPDLPMGYQITQFFRPTCTNGSVKFFSDSEYQQMSSVGITQAHMETDTGKLLHLNDKTFIDYNRAGTPLVEIVTGPDFSSIDDVLAFLKHLQKLLQRNDISDADMEKGQLRVDVNISIRPSESDPLGTRVEYKNINSFRAIGRAIEYEIQRQTTAITVGETINQETRRRDDLAGESIVLRSKEDALDYRYQPEPDLPTLELSDDQQQIIADWQAVDCADVITTLTQTYGFHKEYVNVLLADRDVYRYFAQCCEQGADPLLVIKRMSGPMIAHIKATVGSFAELPFDTETFVKFLQTIKQGSLTEQQAKRVMTDMLEGSSFVSLLETVSSEESVDGDQIAREIVDANPDVVLQYREGKTSTIAFFVGQAMKKTQGRIDANEIKEIFLGLLG